jgi:tetratricopeptide (TPR) repeat protein
VSREIRPLDDAEDVARDLLESAPGTSYGNALLGYVEYERGHQPAAVRHFRAALEVEPNEPDALFYLGIALNAAGQNDEAFAVAETFLAIDPLAPLAHLLAGVHPWFVGRGAESPPHLERALELDPQNLIIRWTLGYARTLLGQLPEAATHARWLREHAPHVPYTAQLSALLEGLGGRRDAVLEILAPLDLAALDAHHTFHIAESFAMAGSTDRALDLVDDAVDRGFYPHDFLALHCPFMEPLRGTKRFAAIVDKARRLVRSFDIDGA